MSTKEEEATAAASTEAADGSPDLETKESSASLAEMKNAFQNSILENGKSVWAMTMETLHMADGGKSKKTDVVVETREEAVEAIKKMVREAKEAEPEEKREKWDMPWTPFKDFEASPDDVLLAFCLWTRKESDDDNNNEKNGGAVTPAMNISKAFCRLEAYVNWMYDNRATLTEPSELTVDSVTPAIKAFGFRITHDAQGRLVWWCDFKQIDVDAIKNETITVKDSVRAIVWFTHLVMLDKNAQDNGMVFIEDLAHKGFFQSITMFPLEVGVQLDRLTVGILPIKMKQIYVLGAAAWMKVLLGMMKPFLSKKMRKRIVTVGPKDAEQKVKDLVGGDEYIPVGVCEGLNGTLENDIIFGKYVVN